MLGRFSIGITNFIGCLKRSSKFKR